MKLVDNWKKCYKWFSVQAMSISAAALGTWEVLPDAFKKTFDKQTVTYLACALLVLGIIGRLVDQEKK